MAKSHIWVQDTCDGKRQSYCGRTLPKALVNVRIDQHESATREQCKRSELLKIDLFWKYNRAEGSPL